MPRPAEHGDAIGADTPGRRLGCYVALGDSQTEGVGDPVRPGRLRGWARRLHEVLLLDHRGLRLHNLARSGAVVADVRRAQLPRALALEPDLITLLIGVNDALRPSFDPATAAADLHVVITAAAATGAVVLVLRLHDPAALLPLPAVLRNRIRSRVDVLNAALDDAVAVAARRSTRPLVLDLHAEPASTDRTLFTVDRLHLNPRGHHALAMGAAAALDRGGTRAAVDDAATGDVADKPWLHARWLVSSAATMVVQATARLAR